MSEELATVYTAMDESDAEVTRMMLDGEGIAAVIEGANQAGLAGCIPVKVQVRQTDPDRAKALIAENEQPPGPQQED